MRRAGHLAAVLACGLAYSGAVASAEGEATDRSPTRAVIDRGRYMMIVGSWSCWRCDYESGAAA